MAERVAETERAVSLALGKTEQLRDQARQMPGATSQQAEAALVVWRQAEAALEQAEAALSTGAAGEHLRQRVQGAREQIEQGRSQHEVRRSQALRKEKLLRDLDEARLARATWIDNQFDEAGASARYAEAFAAYGLEVKRGQSAQLARRIRAEDTDVRDALILALGDWAFAAVEAGAEGLAKELWEIGWVADDDAWRKKYRAALAARDRAALRALSVEARRLSLPPSSLQLLAFSLVSQDEVDEALTLLRWARGRHPSDFWIHVYLAAALRKGKDQTAARVEEAIGGYRAALALRPGTAVVLNDLGQILAQRQDLDEAIACYRKALAINPRHAPAHYNLGIAWMARGKTDQAIACWRQALAIEPRFAPAQSNLGLALQDKGKVEEAIACHQKALEIDPRYAPAHNNLGKILCDVRRDYPGALACFRKALECDPRIAMAHFNLGNVLSVLKKPDDAEAAYRQSLQLDPKYAPAHYALGNALRTRGKPDEAAACYRQALALDPTMAQAHCNLGFVLRRQGRLAESLASFQRGHVLGSKRPGWQYPSAQWVRETEQLLLLEKDLPAVLAGKVALASAAERIVYARLCTVTSRYPAAVRLWAEAFAAEPKLADDLEAGHRYNAACCAALAASKGSPDGGPDGQERLHWRRRALTWLRADLAVWARLSRQGEVGPGRLARQLGRWQSDPNLAGLREKDALARLSAEERQACAKLWADVTALLKRASGVK
jgi:tetratricopeptide (TPR) repeat protein